MNLFFTLAVFSLVSVVIYLSRRAKYRMNLQDLHLHSKAHRSITQAEVVIAKKFAVVIGLNGHRLAQ
ncbi:hypothetical protein ABFV58_14190 [Pseudomonas protegens]|uniref:hypothetical protein n=1 Tax=Pseudomonas protegens TaxID=380021 RepID=UPI0034D70455